MLDYIKDSKSIAGNTLHDIIEKISYRYIQNNSPCEFFAMPSLKNVFLQHADGMFDIDFDKLYPDASFESYAYASTYIYSLQDNKNADEAIISDIVKFVGENYSDYSLTLESVAKEFNIDPKNLSRKFKKYSNMTFHKYLTELKIEEAKRLLITTDMSIEQIYTKVGYVSRTTFIRAFNSVEMVTPSEYRKNARG